MLCIYVCVCVTSNLSSYDHSLCRCSPALRRLGRDAKDVGRLRGQVRGGELTSIRAHLYCDELVGIPRIQTVSYLVSYKTVIRSSEVSLDPPSFMSTVRQLKLTSKVWITFPQTLRVVFSQACFWELKVQKDRRKISPQKAICSWETIFRKTTAGL